MASLPLSLEIPKRNLLCCKGKETLVPGEDYYSLLLEDETKTGFLRQDYCLKCWQEVDRGPFTSYWKAKVPTPPPQKSSKTPESTFEKAFRLLNTAESDAEAFIIALYLARKRRLLLRQEIMHQGHAAYLYENPATEEMIMIKKVDLSSLQREEIQEKLAKKFQ